MIRSPWLLKIYCFNICHVTLNFALGSKLSLTYLSNTHTAEQYWIWYSTISIKNSIRKYSAKHTKKGYVLSFTRSLAWFDWIPLEFQKRFINAFKTPHCEIIAKITWQANRTSRDIILQWHSLSCHMVMWYACLHWFYVMLFFSSYLMVQSASKFLHSNRWLYNKCISSKQWFFLFIC